MTVMVSPRPVRTTLELPSVVKSTRSASAVTLTWAEPAEKMFITEQGPPLATRTEEPSELTASSFPVKVSFRLELLSVFTSTPRSLRMDTTAWAFFFRMILAVEADTERFLTWDFPMAVSSN